MKLLNFLILGTENFDESFLKELEIRYSSIAEVIMVFLDAIASREPGLLVGKLVIIVFKCYKKFQYQAKQAL